MLSVRKEMYTKPCAWCNIVTCSMQHKLCSHINMQFLFNLKTRLPIISIQNIYHSQMYLLYIQCTFISMQFMQHPLANFACNSRHTTFGPFQCKRAAWLKPHIPSIYAPTSRTRLFHSLTPSTCCIYTGQIIMHIQTCIITY